MSETKRLGPRAPNTGLDSGPVGGAWVTNNNPYPVEVTVRRVVEKVTFEGRAVASVEFPGGVYLAPGVAEATQDKGFVTGQRVRVTIEPL